METYRMLGQFVLVQEIEEQLAFGLTVIGEGDTKRARVLAVGTGLELADGKRVPLDVVAGDVVLFKASKGGREIGQRLFTSIDEKTRVILAGDILAVVEEPVQTVPFTHSGVLPTGLAGRLVDLETAEERFPFDDACESCA